MNQQRWDQLCLRHFAGTLAGQELGEFAAALAADPALRLDLLRRAQDEDALRRHFTRVSFDAAVVRQRRSGLHSRRLRAIVALAAAAVLACVFWLPIRADPASVVDAPAVAVLQCPAGTRVDRLPQGRPGGDEPAAIRAGDRLVIGGAGAATLVYSDGSRLQLAAGLVLDVLEGGGAKRLRVGQGTLSASIVGQPRELPMVIATPQLTATVVGTRFTITVDPGATRLSVEEGTVRVDATSGGQSRLVHAGGALEAEDGNLVLTEKPVRADGIASRHPGDRGIAQDPAVLFADGFESGDFRHWHDRDGNPAPANLVVDDPLQVHAGRYAVRLLQAGDSRPVTDLVRWLGPGRDRVHVRCYVRLPADAPEDAGCATPSIGLAAVRDRSLLGSTQEPDGRNLFSSSIDLLRDVRVAGFRPGVRAGADGRFDVEPLVDRPERPLRLTPGRWHCLELMQQANRPGASDGEQRLWLDGVERLHATGQLMRSDSSLGINALWITFLVRGKSAPGRIWVDDLVVATGYVGPQSAESTPAAP